MNNNLMQDNETIYIHYEDPMAVNSTSDLLITYIPKTYSNVVILCIGTDRSTGDSLGPLTGTFLNKLKPKHLDVYGTLHKPVHAVNLEEFICKIKQKYTNPFIIAVDASLGKSSSIGNLI